MDRDRVQLLAPREVPLGGPRAMTVRRTLPQRERSLIGAWCFVDHYGPDDVADTGGMSVPPHPHTGLQTVSWLFTGQIEHRDSAGNHAMVRPGEVNLMTAGRGISHSEVSTPQTRTLHGAQLWVALPDGARDVAPGFAHHAPPPLAGTGWEARVLLGSLLGDTSPVPTATPLLGAELLLDPGATLDLDVDPAFELGVLVDRGRLEVAGTTAERGDLAFVAPGSASLRLSSYDEPVRVLLLGGPPFGEPIVMWWNFVGRSHEEIVGFRAQWQAQIADEAGEPADPGAAGGLREEAGPGERVVRDGQLVRDGRFGVVVGEHLPPIPAPSLPNARLRERR
ncbi:pirin family protein [Nocardioides sp. cx-173]|uniref:pirin family protein n=1 Tax=Nocardioides sp. cx-173 TaxID=2898796 RepID=UPI001E3B7DDA|nr:pirin family protein [Nocardioides sp. cx-173]MCD4524061.1 pirin family protein [Nocardioides sp. cx-173]UGB41462.1 pirin family protein [Nocardioides sp. cx-173]